MFVSILFSNLLPNKNQFWNGLLYANEFGVKKKKKKKKKEMLGREQKALRAFDRTGRQSSWKIN